MLTRYTVMYFAFASFILWFRTSAFVTFPPSLPKIKLSTNAEQRAECVNPINETIAENCLPGTDSWRQDNSLAMQIFASQDSVNVGGTLDFFVDSDTSTFNLNIYRMGYYGGLGARLVQSISDLKGSRQPNCIRVEDTGLRTCSNWLISYSLSVSVDWVSGIYMAQVKDSSGEISNETVFAVRQDNRKSNMLYQMSVTTFQAYNNYAGKSVYTENSGTCDTIADAPRAVKVSMNRPYNAGLWDPNYFFNTEYPMVRWLEQQGYDVSYSTNMDTHRSGKPGAHNALLDHKIFVSVGHDEYWSQEMHDAILAARDAGVHIGFFGANNSFWRIRFEPDPITNEPDSVMVTYKTTESGSPDPSGQPTGTWRDPLGANQPENALLGEMYIGYNVGIYFPLRISSDYSSDPLFRHTGLQNMPPNTYIDVAGQNQLMGWEWDTVVDNGLSPSGLQIIAKSPVYGFLLQDAGRADNGDMGQAVGNTSYYVASSKAIVFAGGSIHWPWGLGTQLLDDISLPPDPYIQQLTYNVLADMGVQPGTPVADLILDDSNVPDPPLPTDRLKTIGEDTGPVISDVEAISDDTGIIIKWNTDVESTSQVGIGTLPNHIVQDAGVDTKYVTEHQITLTGLKTNQIYYFRVASVSHDWEAAISDQYSFTTPNGSLTTKVRDTFAPIVRQGACWVSANQGVTILICALGIGVLAFFSAGILILRRRSRSRHLIFLVS